ncbi:CHASE2 domain-containing protein [Marinobacterium mangrovicola]|uniref:CHASE2 domain-containing sensor protein n=1 Tax=Marinobacterium mangrovicola TaxID=1476959 RepID=A0A4R1GMJ2_9GAMM|nr:CHASE2 domain-containing protein [Marinobacterium mangrovicola]TCK08363.1 CHASE2 domain-containing sensor protein [Marinobacterium mangrovicola]
MKGIRARVDGLITSLLCSRAGFAWKWLFLMLAGGWMIYSNPFGISAATDRASEQAIYRMTSGWYDSEPGQRSILVVLFNDRSIDNLYPAFWQANDWPLSYLDQVNLLSLLMAQKPRALFYDVMWMKRRSVDPSFERALQKLERSQQLTGVPLLLASGTVDAPLEPELAERLQRFAEPVINGWEAVGDYYPLQVNERTTAAMALYQHYCEGAGCTPTAEAYSVPMSVRWSSIPAPALVEHRRDQCRQTDSGLVSALLELPVKLFEGAFQSFIDSSEVPVCAPQRVLYADELMALARSPDPEQRQQLHDWINGSLVLVGGQIEGLQDYVVSPVHGTLPGVFFHAMALDNLMASGESYIRDGSRARPLLLLFWGIFCLALIALRSRRARAIGWTRQLGDSYWLLGGCFVLLMLVFSYGWLHLAPAGWISLLAMGGVGMLLLERLDRNYSDPLNREGSGR